MITFYQIYCLDENITDYYIGSTKQYHKRKIDHKCVCNNIKNKDYNLKVYKFIRENGGIDNWSFKVLNEVEFYGKELRLKMEQVYIDYYKPSLNTAYAYRTYKQYYENNKEKISENTRQYYHNNKELIAKREKEYREKNKEKMAEKTKEYRKKNKELIARKEKEYREKNKEKMAEYFKQNYQKKKEKKKKESEII